MSAQLVPSDTPSSLADEWRASRLSQLTFSWLFPLLRVGATRPLERADLGDPPPGDRVAAHAAAFERAWGACRRTRAALPRAFWSRMAKGAACKAAADACGYAQLFAVKVVISYAEHRAGEAGVAWAARRLGGASAPRLVDAAVALLFACPLLQGLGNHWFYHLSLIHI